jgi:hypothetical protein
MFSAHSCQSPLRSPVFSRLSALPVFALPTRLAKRGWAGREAIPGEQNGTAQKTRKRRANEHAPFHALTNAYSRNSFIVSMIQMPRGYFFFLPTASSAYTHEPPQTLSSHAFTSHFSVGPRVYPTPPSFSISGGGVSLGLIGESQLSTVDGLLFKYNPRAHLGDS